MGSGAMPRHPPGIASAGLSPSSEAQRSCLLLVCAAGGTRWVLLIEQYPLETPCKIGNACGTYPPVVVKRASSWTSRLHRESHREDVWVLQYELGVVLGERRIHELRPAELAVVVLPILAPHSVCPSGERRALEVIPLALQSPVVVNHRLHARRAGDLIPAANATATTSCHEEYRRQVWTAPKASSGYIRECSRAQEGCPALSRVSGFAECRVCVWRRACACLGFRL